MKAKRIAEEKVFTDGSSTVTYELTNGKKAVIQYDSNGIAKVTREAMEYSMELPKGVEGMTTPEIIADLKTLVQYDDYGSLHKETIELAIKALEQQPKMGHWIIDDKEGNRIWHCHCSECNKDPQDYIGGTENWWLVRLPNNCPNCGAYMRGEQE